MQELITAALAAGFSHAGIAPAAALEVRPEVRDMCNADKCRKWNRSWMCPPACGTLEECAARMQPFRCALVVQTTGELEDAYDYENMIGIGRRQKDTFRAFLPEVRRLCGEVLPLTSGGCDECPTCTYPDAPCLHPETAMPSMEACGLMVSDSCTAAGLQYYYGEGTLTYTGCYLYK
ncbi:MAG: DUF2284 domain-containing protein [Oscillospiraceae bacterium]|jgi:predicted metal-binding protein|nr:DUF2284 domain-containing protein [Oscillospiraceae bacterium]